MISYYRQPPPAYYATANRAAVSYVAAEQPFHCDLVSRVMPGMAVLEVGCGTAHLCQHVQDRGGSYTGLDHSPELLEENRRRFPSARFEPIGTNLGANFDLVTSLYTIEHVVHPPDYLEGLWQFCEPGGHVAVICPDFVDGGALPPSLYYGRTPRRLREKGRAQAWGDLATHALDLWWRAPRWKAKAKARGPGAFWMNLQPRALHGASYSIDADAVHLPRLVDLTWWLVQRGAKIVVRSDTMPGVGRDVLRYNCYVLARKPVA